MMTGPLVWNTGRSAFQHLHRQRGELRPAMIDDRMVHGAEDPIRNVGGTWDLEKMPAGVKHDTDEFTSVARSRIAARIGQSADAALLARDVGWACAAGSRSRVRIWVHNTLGSHGFVR